jgi:hypothetical protein
MRSLQILNACTNARRWLPATACAVLLAAVSACGGGGSSTMSTPPPAATTSGCSASTCGAAVMTITDAAGDFLSYKVNLVSLQLQKSDGTMVETLPATTAVDFVQLISLSEVISTRQIPPGNYVAAQVTVDFTNASIMVDDGTGNGVAVNPVDSTGAALGQLALTVQLDNTNNLKITAAKTSRIGFDFNLLASNMVNLTLKTVTVSPVLEASVVPVDNKQVRVRGEISAVDTASSDYTVAVDPFNDHDANDDNNNGSSGSSGNDGNDNDKVLPLVVHTTATTTFEINGTPFSGAAGLAQLATLPANTISVAFGSLSSADQSFTATSVLAGTSVSGGNMDHIQGSVVARVGNTLTVHGARMDDRDGHDDDHFMSGNATITIAAATAVTEQGQASATPAHTIAEISVGSLIDAFGTASTDSSGKVTLDATAGRVRLDLTSVQGALAASATGKITLNLTSIDRQPISLFSFTGTGSAAGVDTDPTRYAVTTGALSLTPFSMGDSVLAIGFVDPFNSAPPDFAAVTLADGVMGDNDDNDNNDDNPNRGKGAQMDIDWGDSGTTTPFKALSATNLDLDVNNSSIGSKHRIQVDPQDVDIEQLPSDVMIVGATSGMTLFAITGRHGRMTDNFQSFADFEKALAADLNGSTTALRLTAQGQYDATSNTFTAQRITILLSN